MPTSAGMIRPPRIPSSDELQDFRKKNGWTQLETSQATGVPIQTWQGWEQKRFQPGVAWLRLLQRTFSDFPR